MTHRPSDECDDCFWWYEDHVLCLGCPNNPETKDAEKQPGATMPIKDPVRDVPAPL